MSIHIVVENVAECAADAAAQQVHDELLEVGVDPESAVVQALDLYGRVFHAVEQELSP